MAGNESYSAVRLELGITAEGAVGAGVRNIYAGRTFQLIGYAVENNSKANSYEVILC